MSHNLVVDGTIYLNGDRVGYRGWGVDFSTYDILYDVKTGISTGDKSISGKFNDYRMLAFGEYNTATNGYSWYLLSYSIFVNIGLFYVQQNIPSEDRRLKIKYKNNTTFNIDYKDGANGLQILGFK